MNKNVLVTGSASGLGREVALHFAAQGYRVFGGVRKPEDAEALSRHHAAITPVILDVADPAQIEAAAALVDRECGEAGLSVLVNAAGYTIYSPIEYTSHDNVVALFDVVTFGPYRLANALLPALKRHAGTGERSKILNVVSWAAFDASPFVGFYAAAKAALLRLTNAQSFELDRLGIDAVAIVPGLMKTAFADQGAGQLRAALDRLPAQGRADYGAAIAHMASMSESAPKSPVASAPAAIAARIFAISQKRRPRDEYDLGFDTSLVLFMNRWLPFSLGRALKRRMYGLNIDAK